MRFIMTRALLLLLLPLSGCFSNPLGSSQQSPAYHPGYAEQPPGRSSISPTQGALQASAGGFASAPGVRLRFTAGAFGNPSPQTGSNVRLRTGLQGVWPHP